MRTCHGCNCDIEEDDEAYCAECFDDEQKKVEESEAGAEDAQEKLRALDKELDGLELRIASGWTADGADVLRRVRAIVGRDVQ